MEQGRGAETSAGKGEALRDGGQAGSQKHLGAIIAHGRGSSPRSETSALRMGPRLFFHIKEEMGRGNYGPPSSILTAAKCHHPSSSPTCIIFRLCLPR